MNYFLCKYIPPRADFLTTLDDQEKELMARHSDFLNALLDQGMIVAHGPVIDPAGVYGVSLFRVADDVDIAAVTATDPIVRHGIGHYEHHPMLHLRTKS